MEWISVNLLLEQKDVNIILGDYFRKRQQEKAKEKAADALKKAEEEFGEVKKAG